MRDVPWCVTLYNLTTSTLAMRSSDTQAGQADHRPSDMHFVSFPSSSSSVSSVPALARCYHRGTGRSPMSSMMMHVLAATDLLARSSLCIASGPPNALALAPGFVGCPWAFPIMGN